MVQLDEKSIALQRLYEKWVIKDTWTVAESASLFLGLEPADADQSAEQLMLQAEMARAVDCGELTCLDGSATAPGFAFEPQAVFAWARRSGVELPTELINLMDFIIKTTMSISSDEGIWAKDDESAVNKDAENILGACVSVLANYPDECRNKNGKIAPERILKLVDEHSDSLFPENLPELSSTMIRDLLNNWILKLRD